MAAASDTQSATALMEMVVAGSSPLAMAPRRTLVPGRALGETRADSAPSQAARAVAHWDAAATTCAMSEGSALVVAELAAMQVAAEEATQEVSSEFA
jgi:hypothetical protein